MKPVNLINYVLNLIRTSKDQQADQKNINLVRFLRAICNHKDQGITQNQEILYKIFDVEETRQLIFLPIEVIKKEVKKESSESEEEEQGGRGFFGGFASKLGMGKKKKKKGLQVEVGRDGGLESSQTVQVSFRFGKHNRKYVVTLEKLFQSHALLNRDSDAFVDPDSEDNVADNFKKI